ncbi:hypothetical protein [Nocardioides marmoraquaticus]
MTAVVKKGVGLVIVLFLLWFLVTSPGQFGALVRDLGTSIWDLLVQLFNALSRFLSTVTS